MPDLHRGRPAGRRVRAAAALGGALLQVARRDDGAVFRPARGARLDGGDRAALRVPAEDAQADPAALHGAGRQRVDENAELRRQADEGLTRRIETLGLASGCTIDDYRKRLDFELSVIEGMKYPGYFLIVADFIKWAKVARDSRSGRAVARARARSSPTRSPSPTSIPIRFGPPVRALPQSERVSMPDFDIDFCQERRDEVIHYVQERYGRDQVAQIITFGTLQARGVLRDVGRVLEMPYGQVDKLTKLVPMNPAAPVTLSKAIAEEPRLQAARDAEPVVRRAFDIAMKLEGLHRHASTHAAGIVIGDRPLSELVPMYRDPKSQLPVTQFNMKWVEQAGW
jgi:DNA polymerase-3 subunit alpha